MQSRAAWVRFLRYLRWVVCGLIILLVGVLIGGHPTWLPGFARSLFVSESQREKVAQQVISLISKDYYRPVATGQLENKSLEGAVASLGDPYSHYYPPTLYRSFQDETASDVGGVGVEVSSQPVDGGVMIEEAVQGSPAARAGLTNGDLVTAVDGLSLAGKTVAQDAALIRGRAGSTVRLTVKHGRHTHTVTVVRAVVKFPVVASRLVTVDGTKIGYLRFTQFAENAAAEVDAHLHKLIAGGARGIVLDLRDNPGGLLKQAVATARLFIGHGTIVTTRGRAIGTRVYRATGHAVAPKIPLVVLVDRGTASSAEILTAALKDDHRALVVGTDTYGKGVFQEVIPVSGGGALDITVGEYFTPDGQNLGGGGVKRGRGVTPNIYVAQHPKDGGTSALKVAERTVAHEVR
jgi:carboxyl-terminal processing protease